jgi:hypothetical protein
MHCAGERAGNQGGRRARELASARADDGDLKTADLGVHDVAVDRDQRCQSVDPRRQPIAHAHLKARIGAGRRDARQDNLPIRSGEHRRCSRCPRSTGH